MWSACKICMDVIAIHRCDPWDFIEHQQVCVCACSGVCVFQELFSSRYNFLTPLARPIYHRHSCNNHMGSSNEQNKKNNKKLSIAFFSLLFFLSVKHLQINDEKKNELKFILDGWMIAWFRLLGVGDIKKYKALFILYIAANSDDENLGT